MLRNQCRILIRLLRAAVTIRLAVKAKLRRHCMISNNDSDIHFAGIMDCSITRKRAAGTWSRSLFGGGAAAAATLREGLGSSVLLQSGCHHVHRFVEGGDVVVVVALEVDAVEARIRA